MSAHKIYPHGDFEEASPGLWILKGSLPFPLARYMTVLRLSNGELLLYSVVALDDAGLAALEKLGKPAVMLVPHPLHIMDAAFYKARYPDLKVIAPDDAKKRLEGKVKVDATPEEGLPPLGVKFHSVPGMKYTEIVLDLPYQGGGRALVFTDLLAKGKLKGIGSLLGPPGGIGIARIVKYRQIGKKTEVKRFLEGIGSADLKWIGIAHGRPVTDDPLGLLKAAAAQL